MNLSYYHDVVEKNQNYSTSTYIKTEKDFDAFIKSFESDKDKFLYRGMNNASFKMYSSSQRYWLSKYLSSDSDKYFDFIIHLIDNTYDKPDVKKYMKSENVQYNEFFILALMQHFGLPSPLIDFSLEFWKAMFFATDNALTNWIDDGSDSLCNYISVYMLPKNIDWVQCSLQTVMKTSAEKVNSMIHDVKCNHPNTDFDTLQTQDNFRYARLNQFRPGEYSNVKFLVVNGASAGRIKISIPELNFNCEYAIINDRLLSQEGEFVTNFTNMPLVEVMNENCEVKFFRCFNIKKNLVPSIVSKYLTPMGVNKNTLYLTGNPNVDKIQSAIDEIKRSI